MATRTRPRPSTSTFCVEPRVRLDGDRATVESYFARLNDSPDGPVVRSFGRYFDVLVRDADGPGASMSGGSSARA